MSGFELPTEPKATKYIPAKGVLEKQAKNVHADMKHDRRIDRLVNQHSKITLSDLKAVKDRVGAIWHLRELEMDKRQKERAAYVEQYHPIQTLDGLDPYWMWKFIRDQPKHVKIWLKAKKEAGL